MPSLESNQLLLAAAAACEDKKAEDIRILALDPAESGLTDYFLICNGTNDRQNVAITDEIEIRLKKDFGVYPQSVEGRRQGEWVLMDYTDFIVHVFSAEKREFYGLERLRKSARKLSVADLHEEVTRRIAEARGKKSSSKTKVTELAEDEPAGGTVKQKRLTSKSKTAIVAKTKAPPKRTSGKTSLVEAATKTAKKAAPNGALTKAVAKGALAEVKAKEPKKKIAKATNVVVQSGTKAAVRLGTKAAARSDIKSIGIKAATGK